MNKSLSKPIVDRTAAFTCDISSKESVKGEVLQEAWPDLADRDTGRFRRSLATPEQRALQETAAGTIHGPAALR